MLFSERKRKGEGGTRRGRGEMGRGMEDVRRGEELPETILAICIGYYFFQKDS